MTVEIFSKEQFETFLDSCEGEGTLGWSEIGFDHGEYVYQVSLDQQVSIMVRSSVKDNGFSADSGDDSLRAWLVDGNKEPLGSKVSKWTTRKPNWQTRFRDVLIQLTKWRMAAGDCVDCGNPLGIFKVKKVGNNKGRIFAKCQTHNNFVWLDERENENGYFSDISSKGNSLESKPEQLDATVSPTTEQLMDALQQIDRDSEYGDYPENSPTEQLESVSDMHGDVRANRKIELNEQQLEAVNAPIDADVRVLAGPGSGKTSGVIVPRYQHLIMNGVKAENIVCVAFNVTMADELRVRLAEGLSDIAKSQICTIHGFCNRQLQLYWKDAGQKARRKYDYKSMPQKRNPEWELKDITDRTYQGWDRKPSTDEVLGWINSFKHTGLSSNMTEALPWYNSALGEHGEYIYEIQLEYDHFQDKQGTLDFADQLYLIERLLIEKVGFRTALQSRFTHVLCDEAQDISSQALRILMTISQEPGWNKIYKDMR